MGLDNHRALSTKEKQRFSLRKLSIGVVSVLLGTTFLFFSGASVSADTTMSTPTVSQNVKATVSPTSTANAQSVTPDDQQPVTLAQSIPATTDPSPAARDAEQPVTYPHQGEDATLALTFVDDDNNGQVINDPSVQESPNGDGVHYAYGTVGDPINGSIYDGYTYSFQNLLNNMKTGYYVPNGEFTTPTIFTAPTMNVTVHMKHATDTWEDQTNTLTRTIHYRRSTDGMDVQDPAGNNIPDYQEQYEITPVVTEDELTNEIVAVTYKIKDLKTGKEWTVQPTNGTQLVLNFEPVLSPQAANPWQAEEATAAGSVTLPELNRWDDAGFMWDSWNKKVTIDYDISYDNVKIGDYVPDDQIQWSTNINVSPDGTKETVYRYFYYGLTDDTGGQ